MELLNALLELEGEQRIDDLTYLSPEQRVPVHGFIIREGIVLSQFLPELR